MDDTASLFHNFVGIFRFHDIMELAFCAEELEKNHFPALWGLCFCPDPAYNQFRNLRRRKQERNGNHEI